MKVPCDFCGSYIESTEEKCPNCGATNTHFVQTASDTPKTIEELKQWCDSHNLKLDHMHIHLGEDFKEPKAFGIYKNGNKFVVYKNKANGERAIRYEGTDEAYAVNELYLKIKEMLLEAKENVSRTNKTTTSNTHKSRKAIIIPIILVGISFWIITILYGFCSNSFISIGPSHNGYYEYNDTLYYRHDNYWYDYNDSLNTWEYLESYPGIDYEYKIDDNEVDITFPTKDYEDDWVSYYNDNDWDNDDDYDWDSDYDDYDFGDSYDWDSDW